jgi:ferredoxin-NADP reductase
MPTATLIQKKELNPSTTSLSFSMKESLGFFGGQYIIVESNIPLNEEKNVKRAYTLASSDSNQKEFTIFYKRIEEGIVTNQYLDHLKIGEEIKFSGPWGKFLKNEEFATKGPTLLVATDTGIATAIGFLQSERMKNILHNVDLKWFVPSNDYFLSKEKVEKTFSGKLGNFEIHAAPPFGKERGEDFYMAMETLVENSNYSSYFLCGDGEVVKRGKEVLLNRGHDEEQIGTKTYFNK